MGDGRATDRPSDRPSDDRESRWISFNDLAALRGISRASASKLVRRHGWRRQIDNKGHVLILVPVEALDRPSDSPAPRPRDNPLDTPSAIGDRRATDRPPVSPSPLGDDQLVESPSDRPSDSAFETALAAIEAAHAGEVAALRERADASEQARIAAQTLSDTALAKLTDTSARSDAEIATLRSIVDSLRGTIAREETRAASAERRATVAESEASELRTAADQARADAEKARQAADARIASLKVEAEAKVAQAREQAEAQRTAIEELRGGQGLLAETHAAELAAAQDAAKKAEEAAESLRQVEEARKGRGRLRRAWDGWRGR